jgi:hypothetical protein
MFGHRVTAESEETIMRCIFAFPALYAPLVILSSPGENSSQINFLQMQKFTLAHADQIMIGLLILNMLEICQIINHLLYL